MENRIQLFLASLARILQKQSHSIRALKIMNAGLSNALLKCSERLGMNREQFQKLVQESVARAEKSASPSLSKENIAKEIAETANELSTLQEQAEKPPN